MIDLLSNVLIVYFDPGVDQRSPIAPEMERVVKKDEKGAEYVEYLPFDSPSYQKSLGRVSDWSLTNLLEAGVDPRFNIHTTSATRAELAGNIQAFEEEAAKIQESLKDHE